MHATLSHPAHPLQTHCLHIMASIIANCNNNSTQSKQVFEETQCCLATYVRTGTFSHYHGDNAATVHTVYNYCVDYCTIQYTGKIVRTVRTGSDTN